MTRMKRQNGRLTQMLKLQLLRLRSEKHWKSGPGRGFSTQHEGRDASCSGKQA